MDFSGFGFSFGEWAMSNLEELYSDLLSLMNIIDNNYPLFLVGHSMGGGILLSFLKLNPNLKISGIICSNPFIDFADHFNITFIEKTMIHFLPKKLLRMSYHAPVDPFLFANDPKII